MNRRADEGQDVTMPFPLEDVEGFFERISREFIRRQRDANAVTTHCAIVLIESARDDILENRNPPFSFTKVELRERTFERMRAEGEQKHLDAHTFTKAPDHVASLLSRRAFDDAKTQLRVRFAGPTYEARGGRGDPEIFFLIPSWDVLPDEAIVRREEPPFALIRRSGAVAGLILHLESGDVRKSMDRLFDEDLVSRKPTPEEEQDLLAKIRDIYAPGEILGKLDEMIAWLVEVFLIEVARDDIQRYFREVAADARGVAAEHLWESGEWLTKAAWSTGADGARTKEWLVTAMRLSWIAIAEHLRGALLHLLLSLRRRPRLKAD